MHSIAYVLHFHVQPPLTPDSSFRSNLPFCLLTSLSLQASLHLLPDLKYFINAFHFICFPKISGHAQHCELHR